MCAIAQHFGRPGTPTDQAWIESLFSHLKGDWRHLDSITDPAVLRAELVKVRQEYNTVRLHAGIGYVTPDDEHEGRGEKIAARAAPGCATPAGGASNTTAPNAAARPDDQPACGRGRWRGGSWPLAQGRSDPIDDLHPRLEPQMRSESEASEPVDLTSLYDCSSFAPMSPLARPHADRRISSRSRFWFR